MQKEIKSVAFDLGGVLLFQDFSELTEEENFLFTFYMNRNKQEKMNEYYQQFGEEKAKKILEYAEEQMSVIYPKIHKPYKDTFQTLKVLKEEKITPSIWTNNIRVLSIVLEKLGFYDYIDPQHVINSIDFGYLKPSEGFYRYALQKTKQVPNEVLFIDDNLKNVEGAKKLNIHGMHYIETEEMPLKEQTLEEIKKIEKRL